MSPSPDELKIQFPEKYPLAFASVKPKAGWTYTATKAKLATPVKTDDGEVTDYTSVIEWKAAARRAGSSRGSSTSSRSAPGRCPRRTR